MGAGCFPGVSDGKESAFCAGDPGSIPGLGRSPAISTFCKYLGKEIILKDLKE